MTTKEFDDLGVMLAIGTSVFLAGYVFGIFMCQKHPEKFDIGVVPNEIIEVTTGASTMTSVTSTGTSMTTRYSVGTTYTTCYEVYDIETACVTDLTETMEYLGSFVATYYQGDCVPCTGGSGRMLVSCYEKETSYKGSIASRYVFEKYRYFVNGKTEVYIEFPSYERLNGWYSVDDCNADYGIVDFYFADYSTCPWQFDGVTTCDVWIGV